MKWTGLNELREMYLKFFESKDHYRFESFPLVPLDDNSLLLINSGMAPLKKYFLGQQHVPNDRATSCQKCIRTPDIERVGKTARHGTYFEMLGNFSFANYFKKEATAWAWEFCTEVLKLPIDRLYVSVFFEDDEAYDIWTKDIGVAGDKMVRLGREDNFWEIGAGPCGPCSEIYFDRGEKYGCDNPNCAVGCDCDRYVEFWNLVFTQFISDGAGNYQQMEHGNIDTGMGLERLACIMQDVGNLFEVDTVQNIMKEIEKQAGVKYKQDEKVDVSLRVITDHIRSTSFMIGDGVGPSNEGRGYVLRRLLRRAARHGRLLGINKPFLHNIVDIVVSENVSAYPYLAERKDYIKRIVKSEEEKFLKTIEQGFELLDGIVEQLAGQNQTVFSGEVAFKLYDTFGFPLDLTKDIVEEKGFTVDEDKFNELMQVQKKRARDERKSKDDIGWEEDVFKGMTVNETEFVGYDSLETKAVVEYIINAGELSETASEGEKVVIILDKTPFYAEGGGQVGDIGTLSSDVATIEIVDCKKSAEGLFRHIGIVKSGVVEKGAAVTASVDKKFRNDVMRNHTSAHLLQYALREVLGDHVHQSGSYVDRNRVRFDFSHFEAMTKDEIKAVEKKVNAVILDAIEVTKQVMSIDQAKKLGAIALFGEKYGDTVRVVSVPGVSVEFCGGTHIKNTAEVGLFKILSESSSAAGIRRIEATTGKGVLQYIEDQDKVLADTCAVLKLSNSSELASKTESLQQQLREKSSEVEALNAKLANSAIDDIIKSAKDLNDLKVIATEFIKAKPDTVKGMLDTLKEKYPNIVAVVSSEWNEKTTIFVGIGKQALAKGLNSSIIVKEVAAICGGSGGGKPDLAMAGVKDTAKLKQALESVVSIVEKQI